MGDGKYVHFSKGNLQYQASTGTWKFADNQYDVIGVGNENISSTYDGWIDLFGWGTSGWNSGAVAYQPWATSSDPLDYHPGGDYMNSLTGEYANADWGVYNKIRNGGNKAGLWRTPTVDEIKYLMNNSSHGTATVCGTKGVIYVPEVFNPNRSLDRMWFFSDIAMYSIFYSFFLFGIFLLVARSLCPHNSLAPRQKSAQK